MRLRLVVCASVFPLLDLTGCAARSSPASLPPGDWTVVRGPRYTAMIPDTIAGFAFTGHRVDYPNPALGTMLRYRAADSLAADVYVYPSPVDGVRCGAPCADSLAQSEARSFGMTFTMTQLRTYDSAVVMRPDTLYPAEGERWLAGSLVRVRGTRRGRQVASDFFLFLPPLHYVKVRASYLLRPGTAARVEAFARAAAAGVMVSGR